MTIVLPTWPVWRFAQGVFLGVVAKNHLATLAAYENWQNVMIILCMLHTGIAVFLLKCAMRSLNHVKVISLLFIWNLVFVQVTLLLTITVSVVTSDRDPVCPQFRVQNDSSDVNNTSAANGVLGGGGVGLAGKSKFSNAVFLFLKTQD